jgi:hypothetical protein
MLRRNRFLLRSIIRQLMGYSYRGCVKARLTLFNSPSKMAERLGSGPSAMPMSILTGLNFLARFQETLI